MLNVRSVTPNEQMGTSMIQRYLAMGQGMNLKLSEKFQVNFAYNINMLNSFLVVACVKYKNFWPS